MCLRILIFKRQIEESTKDTGGKMIRKGEVDKVIPGRLRVEKISEWRKSIDSFISCRKLS